MANENKFSIFEILDIFTNRHW